MKKKISSISWVWDKYRDHFTEIRKAIGDEIELKKIPTNQASLKELTR
tara:strand:- start:2126 stop:2269 length:144 start_codon:yes stop_codon:yes gene_type:complete